MAKGTMDPEVRVLGNLLRVLEEVPERDRRQRICRWLSARAGEVWPVDREQPTGQWEPWHQALHDQDQYGLFDQKAEEGKEKAEEVVVTTKATWVKEEAPTPEPGQQPEAPVQDPGRPQALAPAQPEAPARPLPPPPPPRDPYAPPAPAEIQAETGLG